MREYVPSTHMGQRQSHLGQPHKCGCVCSDVTQHKGFFKTARKPHRWLLIINFREKSCSAFEVVLLGLSRKTLNSYCHEKVSLLSHRLCR